MPLLDVTGKGLVCSVYIFTDVTLTSMNTKARLFVSTVLLIAYSTIPFSSMGFIDRIFSHLVYFISCCGRIIKGIFVYKLYRESMPQLEISFLNCPDTCWFDWAE